MLFISTTFFPESIFDSSKRIVYTCDVQLNVLYILFSNLKIEKLYFSRVISTRETCFVFIVSTGFPTRYRTRHFFNNFTTNEDIATKFEADLPHCVRNVKEKNLLLFKFSCNIFIGVRISKEMPGSLASGTPSICHVPFGRNGVGGTEKGLTNTYLDIFYCD